MYVYRVSLYRRGKESGERGRSGEGRGGEGGRERKAPGGKYSYCLLRWLLLEYKEISLTKVMQ